MQQATSLSELDFVQTVDGRLVSTWSPTRTGDHAKDCATGRTYGVQMLDLMRRQSNPVLLGQVTQGIVSGGIYSGVEIGFMQAIAEATS